MNTFSGHWDTIKPIIASNASKANCMKGHAEKLLLPDGDFVKLVYFDKPKSDNTVLVLPGMAANAQASSVQHCCMDLLRENYCPVVLEFRNCSTEPNISSHFYNAGSTHDLQYAIHFLNEKISAPVLNVVGFSLGSINAVQWSACESDSKARVKSLTCVSLAPDLCQIAIQANQGFNKLYQARLLRIYWQRLSRRESLGEHFDMQKFKNIKSMQAFDENITVPMNGYKSLSEYYANNSAKHFLEHVPLPCSIHNAVNDPLVPAHSSIVKPSKNPNLAIHLLKRGGHMGISWGEIAAAHNVHI